MARKPSVTWDEGHRLVAATGRERWLAQRVQREREARGWSQQTLSTKMRDAGHPIHQSAISKIESTGEHRRSITADEAIGFSKVFNIPLGELLLPADALLDMQMLRDVADGPRLLQNAYLSDLEYRDLVRRVAERARGSETWRRQLIEGATQRQQLEDPDSLAGQFYRDVIAEIGDDIS